MCYFDMKHSNKVLFEVKVLFVENNNINKIEDKWTIFSYHSQLNPGREKQERTCNSNVFFVHTSMAILLWNLLRLEVL